MRKAFRKGYDWFRRLSLRTRLFLFISILLIFAVSTLSLRVIDIYQRDMIRNASEQTLSSLRQTAQSINQKLKTINDSLDQISMDSGLTDFFISKQTDHVLEERDIFLDSKFLGNTINRYLLQEDIEVYLLFTTPYIIGALLSTQSPALKPESFRESSVYQAAVNAGYATVWLPTYDITEVFHLESMADTSRIQDNRFIFSAVRQLNFMYFENNTLRVLPTDAERPIIMINFLASVLPRWIGDNIGYEGLRYRLLDENGAVFFSSGDEEEAQPFELYKTAEEGVSTYGEGSAKRMAFITRIDCTNWHLTCDIPMSVIAGKVTRNAFTLILGWIAILMIITLVLAYLLSREVTMPIAHMVNAVQKVAAGDFSVHMKVPQEKEFWELTNAFNRMGSEIQRLIHENYAISLQETRSQLAALNLQLNPHFLNNTLNVMNMIALENNQRELSEMITALSKMLQYSLKQSGGLVSLKDELEWLKNYLTVMEARYEGMFQVIFDVGKSALHFDIPKLILQPIVENCFVHGGIGTKPGGLIILSAHLVDDHLVLSVEDNGLGIDAPRVHQEMRLPASDQHISLRNIYQRMKLIYGQNAEIRIEALQPQGSKITLLISRLIQE